MDIAHGIPQALVDRFEPLSLIGQGGMGVVYLARDRELGRPVAIKLLIAGGDELEIQRFAREAAVLARLAHPRIVRVFDAGTAGGHAGAGDAGAGNTGVGGARTGDAAAGDAAPGDTAATRAAAIHAAAVHATAIHAVPVHATAGVPYIVMEYLEGQSLSERLQQGPLRPAELATLIEATLAGLQAIHDLSILHRDIKPSNIFLVRDRGPVLLDFGVALPPDVPSLTRSGRIVGTLRYFAPELLQGQTATIESDLFAVGVMLIEAWLAVDVHGDGSADGFEMRPGRLLASLSSGTYLDTARRALTGRGPLGTALLKLLSPLPEARFASVAPLSAFLAREGVLATLGSSSPSLGPVPRTADTAQAPLPDGDGPGTGTMSGPIPIAELPPTRPGPPPPPGRRRRAVAAALAAVVPLACLALAWPRLVAKDPPVPAPGLASARSATAWSTTASPAPPGPPTGLPSLGTGLRAAAAGIVDHELWPSWLRIHQLVGQPGAEPAVCALCGTTIDRMIELAPFPGRDQWIRALVLHRLACLEPEVADAAALTDHVITLRKDRLLLDDANRLLARLDPAGPITALTPDVDRVDERGSRLVESLARCVDVYLETDQVLETRVAGSLAIASRSALGALPKTRAAMARQMVRWRQRHPGHWAVLYIGSFDEAGNHEGDAWVRSIQDAIDALDRRFDPAERLSRADVFCIRFEMRRELVHRLHRSRQRDRLDPLVRQMLSEVREAERLHPTLLPRLDRMKSELLATAAPEDR